MLPLAALSAALPGVAHADVSAYVRARAAAADGAVDAAAAGYAAALLAAPGDEVVAIRAYRNALASGDLALAKRAAAVLKQAQVAPMDVAILDLAGAIQSRDRIAADDALGQIGAGPLDFIAPVVRAWLAFERGGDPFAILDNATDSGLGRRYLAEHRALLLIAAGRDDEALAAVRAALVGDPGSIDLRWNAAVLLTTKGKRKLALSLLAGDDPVMTGLRASLRRGIKPGAAYGTGRALTRLASDLAGQQTETLSIVLTRAALSLDPTDDRARLLLADALQGEQAYAGALTVLEAIRPGSAFFPTAQSERISLIKARGEGATALGIAASLADRPGASVADRLRYADLLVETDRDAEAAKVYGAVLSSLGEQASWVNHLQLGGALERAGQWQAALPHLRKAVELGPEQAVALNYLGYALVERNEGIAEGQGLLERASKLRPDDPSITDSLGWAYFRGGDYAKALPLLERAAQGNPASATINEHLGDVYWQTGRRYEARYAWRAAAVYADGAQWSRITAKLSDGLKGDPPVAQKRTDLSRRVGTRADRWVELAPGPAATGAQLILTESAPAKLNLALHVRRRRDDGYHELETLFAFVADGDEIALDETGEGFAVTGPFAGVLAGEGDNLVTRAATRFAEAFGAPRTGRITLTKRLPVASGLGGGSADAAATLRLLARRDGIALDDPRLFACADSLGSDVPVCLYNRTALGTGRGEQLQWIEGAPGTPVLLVNPGVAVSTAAVFGSWDGVDRGPMPGHGSLIERAQAGRNDLYEPAAKVEPIIRKALEWLEDQSGAALVRMSGSGATCFAIFDDSTRRADAARRLRSERPGWWCLETVLL